MRSSVTQRDRDEMARLLEAAGSAYDPEEVEALIEGVLAAPAEIGTGWHRLVAGPMPQQLADCLEAPRGPPAGPDPPRPPGPCFSPVPRPAALPPPRRGNPSPPARA